MLINPLLRLLRGIEKRALTGMVFLTVDDIDDLEQHNKTTLGVFLRFALDAIGHPLNGIRTLF